MSLLHRTCAALLHDVGRTAPGPESELGARSAELAAPLLAELPLSEADRQDILIPGGMIESWLDDLTNCVLPAIL